MGAAVFFAGDGFGSQSFVEKKFSDATDAWDRSDRTLESISRFFSESTSAAMLDRSACAEGVVGVAAAGGLIMLFTHLLNEDDLTERGSLCAVSWALMRNERALSWEIERLGALFCAFCTGK